MSTRTAPQKTDSSFGTKATPQDNRRRRPRLKSEAIGYLLRADAAENVEPTEVLVQDVSRLGVGFVTSNEIAVNAVCRIRIGYGPMRLARRIRVMRCETVASGTFFVGAEFV